MTKLDPVLRLLTSLVIAFALLLFVSEHFFPMDGQIFQVMSNLLSGFGGALLMRVKPSKTNTEDDASIPTITDSTMIKKSHTEPATIPVTSKE